MKLASKTRSIILFIIIFFSLLSCNRQIDFYKESYEFINLTKYENELIIYKPCNANILKLTIKKDTLFRTTHQDGIYTRVILKNERINESEFFLVYNLTDDISDTIHLKKKKQLWDIDGRLYTESKFKQNYKYVEQPCIECFSKEECDEFKKNDLLENNSVKNNNKVTKLNVVDYNEDNAVLSVAKEWYGEYYFRGGELNLDYILYFSEKGIKLTTQARQYGYSDQLKAVKIGDTLGLYHHKNISGMNYDETRKYDFLKFYKASNGKFYFEGKLPYLPNRAIEFKKVK